MDDDEFERLVEEYRERFVAGVREMRAVWHRETDAEVRAIFDDGLQSLEASVEAYRRAKGGRVN